MRGNIYKKVQPPSLGAAAYPANILLCRGGNLLFTQDFKAFNFYPTV
jgi:hypothetical protein